MDDEREDYADEPQVARHFPNLAGIVLIVLLLLACCAGTVVWWLAQFIQIAPGQ